MAEADDGELKNRMHRLETLLKEVDDRADPATKSRVRQIVQSLMDYHGAAIEKMVEAMATNGEAGRSMLGKLADDELVSSVLLLYGLHPLDLETRVRNALEKVRPYLRSHGGNVELLSIEEGAVRLRMEGSCHGCPSSAMTIKSSIETAIYEAAPDVGAILVEGESESATSGDVEPFVEERNGSRVALPILKG
jgi:Fe-S cluster biogenesis protein NfuA